MNEKIKWRNRARAALEAYFHKRSFPKITLSVLLALTGGFGFLISFGLLKADFAAMWLRYPVAVLGAYGFFLLLLRGWVEIEKARFAPEEIDKLDLQKAPASLSDSDLVRTSEGKSGWLDYLDIPDFGVDFFDEGCLPIILVGAAIGLVCTLAFTVFAAPALIAEVFLDLFLVSMLYRRLRIASSEHWLGTAVRQTWTTAAVAAILLMIIGGCLQLMAPESRSIGPAMRELWAKFGG